MTKKQSEELKWQDKFPIGSRWRNREGSVVEIIDIDDCYAHPIVGMDERYDVYGFSGMGVWLSGTEHKYDLIERIDDKEENYNIEDIFEEASTKLNELNESKDKDEIKTEDEYNKWIANCQKDNPFLKPSPLSLEEMAKSIDWKDEYPIGSKWETEMCIETVIHHGDDYIVTDNGDRPLRWRKRSAGECLRPYKEPEEITAYFHVLENGCFHASYSKMESVAHYRVVARKKITIKEGELDD